MAEKNDRVSPRRRTERHWRQVYLVMFLVLPALSALVLVIEHYTHIEFLLHVAAIPLEILLGAFLIERFLARKERQAKLQQLMYIKSYIFRSEMRGVFLTNFRALESPPITIAKIRDSSLEELRRMKAGVKGITYRSVEDVEAVVMAYVRSHAVFQTFLEWSIANDVEEIFHDMLKILHFIQDVRLFKARHPDRPFIREAERQPELLEKVYAILRQGIEKFLDYTIELKEKQPDIFDDLMADYQISDAMQAENGGESPEGKAAGEYRDEVVGMRTPSHPGMRLMNISP